MGSLDWFSERLFGSSLSNSASRADRLSEAARVGREVELRELDLLLLDLDVLRAGFGFLPLPRPRPLCICW